MVRYAKLVFFFFSPMVAHPLLVGWANIGWGASGTARPDNAVSCLRPHSLWGAPILDRLLFVFFLQTSTGSDAFPHSWS